MFEIHITATDEDFEEICERNNLKSLLITEDTGSGVDQKMMAKFVKSSLEESLDCMHSISGLFSKVIRRKLEYIGKNPPECLYREYHSKFEVPAERESEFKAAVESLGGHSSKNSRRPGFMFATARDRETYERLNGLAFRRLNSLQEFVVYDDNPGIDSNWRCDCGIKDAIQSLD